MTPEQRKRLKELAGENATTKAGDRQRRYLKNFSRVRGQKVRHGLNPPDCANLEMAMDGELPCDWCGFDFDLVNTPQVDHDHRCECGARRSRKANSHCTNCVRGFVHRQCNREIGALEWREATFGATDTKLRSYRLKFPVPRLPK
jgi:hypothetical protein